MFFIGPPFGNYITLPYCKSVIGSYTVEERTGLLIQIAKTLRYDFALNGWVNKIGLRNRGIDYGVKHYNHSTDILSLAILKETDVDIFLHKIPKKNNIEINISCPNINRQLINQNLQGFLNSEREWCILKCGPHIKKEELHTYYELGFKQFHFCNTLPVPNGGLSGKALIPYTQNLSKHMKTSYDDVTIISGGGINAWKDVENYNYGDHHAISTVFFNPIKFAVLYFKYVFQQ